MSIGIVRRACEWLACHLPVRKITRGVPPYEGDYLDRYYLAGRAPAYFPTRCRFCGKESDWKSSRMCTVRKNGRYLSCESVPFPTRFAFLPTVFLHHFLDSDQEEELHNHPWNFAVSLILVGGYVEERRVNGVFRAVLGYGSVEGVGHGIVEGVTTTRDVLPGRINVIRANDFHRAILRERDAWTLFVTFKKEQSWGFWSKKTGEFVPWRRYREWKSAQVRRSKAAAS